MGDDGGLGILVVILFCAVGIASAIGYAAGATNGTKDGIHQMRQAAVEHNHAEWQVESDGSVIFHWK